MKYSETFFLIVVVGSLLLSGCMAYEPPSYAIPQAGQANMVHYNAVLRNLRDAALGDPTKIIAWNEAKRLVLVGWDHVGGWGWVCLRADLSVCNALHEIGGRGTHVTVEDFRILMNAAEKGGWRQITATDLVKVAPHFAASLLKETAGVATRAMTTIFVAPVGIFPQMPGVPVSDWQ